MNGVTGRLRRFDKRLREIVGNREGNRPFVCDRSPYDCLAFLVGINPASQVLFWEFWSESLGFDRAEWLKDYKNRRIAEALTSGRGRQPPMSPTRQRIEIVVDEAHPVKVLETNLYIRATRSASQLRVTDRDMTIFDFLLEEIEPSILVLHGKEARDHFEIRFSCALSPNFSTALVCGREVRIAAVRHLSRMSYRDARRLGESLRAELPAHRTCSPDRPQGDVLSPSY